MSESEKTNDESGRGPETVDEERGEGQIPDSGHELPLFLRDKRDGQKGNQQDEKDEIGE